MIKTKKIIFLSTTYLTLDSFLKDHIKNLVKRGHKVYLISNFEEKKISKPKSNLFLINLKFRRKINVIQDIYCLFKLVFLFNSIEPQMVVSISPKAGLITAIASYLTNIKIRLHIFTGQVWSNKKNILFKNLLFNLDKLISYLSTNILVDSFPQKRFLIKHNVISSKKSKVILNGSMCGVDTQLFKKNIHENKKLRKKLNIRNNSIVISYIGRINKEKGIKSLLNVFSNLLKKKKNLTLLLVGKDEMDIKKIINNKKIIKKIKIISHSKNIEKFFQISDIFCLPSEREGFGLSLIEASSCQVPIICSDIYGIRDTMINNVTGYKYKLKNDKKFFQILYLLINNSKLRSKLGIQGRIFVKKKFERKKVINEFSKYFNFLLSK